MKTPPNAYSFENATPVYVVKGNVVCWGGQGLSSVSGDWRAENYHIIPSSPIPGKPATFTPSPKPAAAIWLLSLSSGLQGGECCL